MLSSLHTKRSSDLHLYQYSGSGNRFFIYDGRLGHFSFTLTKQICDEYGLDGIIVLEKSLVADYGMRIFNADGSVAQMCGNGLRCLMKFLVDRGLDSKPTTFETLDGIYTCFEEEEEITIQMRPPRVAFWDFSFSIDGIAREAAFLHLGVPHLILFFDEIEWESLEKAFITANAAHPQFPEGTNVSGVQRKEASSFYIRTIERGVGRETGACGTGATAAALSLAKRYQLSSPLSAIPLSKEALTVSFTWKGDVPHEIYLKGPAQRELSVNYSSPYNVSYDKN